MSSLGLVYIPSRAKLFKEEEANARKLIESALVLGEIKSLYPYDDKDDEWWEKAYGISERELEELLDKAVKDYKKSRAPWKNSTRKESLKLYAKAISMLNVARGLETNRI